MAEEDYLAYKDISELKKEFEGIRGKKDISMKDLNDSVQKLTQTMNDMLEIFSASAEQVKQEEKEYQTMVTKLDKLLDQNKTIAEGMVAIVELVKEKFGMHEMHEKAGEGSDLKSIQEIDEPVAPEPKPFLKPTQPPIEWVPKGPMMAKQPMTQSIQQPMPQAPQTTQPFDYGMPDFGAQLPPMEPEPMPDLELPEEPFAVDEPKKKGLFGLFKK